MNPCLELLQDIGLAAVPAVGFAMLFNVPRAALKYCAVAGGAGHALRLALCQYAGLPVEWGTLVAACAISLLGIHWAQKWRAHPKVFTVAGMITMIPGVQAFTALLALLQIEREGFTPELFKTAVDNGLKAVFIVAALAVGLALPGMLFYRRRPVV